MTNLNYGDIVYRQGDVGLELIKSLPRGLKEVKDKTLALGEVTGHKHKFVTDEAKVWEDDNGNKYIAVLSPATLYHGNETQIAKTIEAPEKVDYEAENIHKPNTFHKAFYRVVPQIESDPYGGVQNVRD